MREVSVFYPRDWSWMTLNLAKFKLHDNISTVTNYISDIFLSSSDIMFSQ